MKLIDRLVPGTVSAARAAVEAEGVLVQQAYREDRRDVRVRGWLLTDADRALVDRVDRDRETGRYFDPEGRLPIDTPDYWTAYCGGCGEEIDVVAWNEADARRIVEAAIVLDYEPMNIDRIESRSGGLIYF